MEGAGLIDAYDAVYSTATACANLGMDINLDLAGTAHYGGHANRDVDGNYYLMGLEGDGYVWNGAYLWNDGYLWSDGFLWNDAYLWNDGFLWNDAYLWGDAYVWNDAYLWNDGLSTPAAINRWVDQQ